MEIANRLTLTNKRNKNKGFTLVELVIVIVLLGIMATGITGFISLSTQTYVNVADRDELIASARFAVERLNRELRNAVPNSVRIKNDATRQCLEFVPIVTSTIYTDIPVSPEPLSNLITVIPFLGEDGLDYQCNGFCLDIVTSYPLNSGEIFANQFDGIGKVFGLSAINQTTANEWTLTLDRTLGVNFDSDSPTKRLYIVRTPVSYCVNNSQLRRYANYGYAVNQSLSPFAFSNHIMAENLKALDTSKLPFSIQEATLQRNAIVQIRLDFSKGGEDIVFNNEINIKNIP